MRQLPFPRFAASRLEQLDGRLRYPPPGSPDFDATEEELSVPSGERLSAEPCQEENAAVDGKEGAPEEQERK